MKRQAEALMAGQDRLAINTPCGRPGSAQIGPLVWEAAIEMSTVRLSGA
jgi:hypothetical protein